MVDFQYEFKCVTFKSVKRNTFCCEIFVEGIDDKVLRDNKVCIQILELLCVSYVLNDNTRSKTFFCFVHIHFILPSSTIVGVTDLRHPTKGTQKKATRIFSTL